MITKKDFENRIDELCELKPGWLDGEQGGTYNKDDLYNFKRKTIDSLWIGLPYMVPDPNHSIELVFQILLEENLLPYIYPTLEDNVIRLEWNNSVEIDVNVSTYKMRYIGSEKYEDKEFDFDKECGYILGILLGE